MNTCPHADEKVANHLTCRAGIERSERKRAPPRKLNEAPIMSLGPRCNCMLRRLPKLTGTITDGVGTGVAAIDAHAS